MHIKTLGLKTLGLASLLALAGLPATAQTQTIRVGVTPGPHAQIFEVVKPIAAAKGLDIKIIEFSD
ncbi:MAG: MetQ/NlpA family ABC transporter substrate-binding protein, partial [Microvirga sp.]